MRRHFIVGRFGAGDRAQVRAAQGEVLTRLEFVVSKYRLEHGIGRALDDLAKFGVFPSEIGVDLLVFAAHVYAADTHINRATESQDAWTREIRLEVPVSDVARWSAVVSLLQRMLNFLTGDRWTVGFRARPAGFDKTVAERNPNLFAPPYDSLGLFSGGLDSLIGAIDELESGKTPLLISHAGEGATSDAQGKLFDKLKHQYGQRTLDRLRLWMDFRNWGVRGVKSENTTRGRSFLFFAAAVLAGTGLTGTFTLRVPENGLISLNVPLDPLRLGSLSTRTTHPFYMARWNELLIALGINGRLENPYWDKTKGEMVANCANKGLLTKLHPDSLSCASPAKARWMGKAGRGIEHCGHCLPCLIRRAALRKGLGSADRTGYTVNLKAHVLNPLKAEGEHVRAFQFAIERLRQNPRIASLVIHKPGSLLDESPARQVVLSEVYRRGLKEVAGLLSGVRTAPKFS